MTGSLSRFRNTEPSRKEIDLRAELNKTLYGSDQEIAKSYRVLVRRMRTDSKGRRLPCICNYKGEGSTKPECPVCLGEGYYWDETWEDSFKMEIGSESAKARRVFLDPAGDAKAALTRFFFKHDVDIIEEDRIIEVKVDGNGDPIKPYVRWITWQVQEVEDKRSDNGRQEFVVAYCSKLTHIRTSPVRR